MKTYTNTTSALGWKEYVDNWGQEWRREDLLYSWYFYKKRKDVFIFHGSIMKISTKSLKTAHEFYMLRTKNDY